jgi:methylated-DNA-[protein]-cysteine S-methyltransferase
MSATVEFALFDTPIGRCGIAWNGDVIEGTMLPEARVADTRRRLQDQFEGPEGQAVEGTPPPAIRDAIDRMVASLRGEADDLVDVPLDLDALPRFRRRVLEVVRTIPAGETLSYGEVAAAVGSPGAARAVGQALGRNPFPIVVPCHRVLAAGGRIGGFTAPGGVSVKAKMLAAEGVTPPASTPVSTRVHRRSA